MKSYETNKELKKKHKAIKRLIIAAVILLPCIAFGVIMYRGYVKTNAAYDQKEREYTELAMSYVTDDDSPEAKKKNGDAYMRKKVNFQALSKKQSDIYAWITIPDTGVNYPILQSGDDKKEDYWLNHNLDGSYGYPGTIFTEKMFGKDFKSFNTVIYGHNMKNQTMFGVLHNFSKKDYFNKHPNIYLYTKDVTYKYEIVCASTISDAHLAIAYNGYNTEQQRQQFLDYIKTHAEISTETKTGIYDNYITLSTCTYDDEDRFVILAKCMNTMAKTAYD